MSVLPFVIFLSDLYAFFFFLVALSAQATMLLCVRIRGNEHAVLKLHKAAATASR